MAYQERKKNNNKSSFIDNPGLSIPMPNNSAKLPQDNSAKPMPVQDRTVFNNDGTVTVRKNGTEQTLSQDDYKEYNRKFMAGSPANAQTSKGVGDLLSAQNIDRPENIAKKQESQRIEQAKALASQIDSGPSAVNPNLEAPNITADILTSIGQKAAVGAGTGAVAGLATGGTLSAPGALVGGAAGAVTGAFTVIPSLKEEYTQATQKELKTLREGQQALDTIITSAKSGIVPQEQAILDFQLVMGKIDQAEANTRKLAEKDWLSKAKPELEEFEIFQSYQRQSYSIKLANALTQ